MIFYFYKITNLINQKYYYGVHSTNNINDNYMGSGKAIKRAIKKYGVQNFSKQILYYFSNKQQMYDFQEKYVTQELVDNSQCYNMVVGCNSSYSNKKRSLMAKQKNQSQQAKAKRNKSIKKYWSTGDVQQKKQRHGERIKKAYKDNPDMNKKISQSLLKYWNEQNSFEKRKKQGQTIKNSEKHKIACQNLKNSGIFNGYNNPDFIKRWKKVYEKDMNEICELIKYSNLPQQFIIKKLYNKKIHMSKIMKYYKYIGNLPDEINYETRNRFLRFNNFNNKGHKDGRSKKTIFTNEIKYDIMFYFQDFFIQFKKIIEFMNNDKLSDSNIINIKEYFKQVPNFHQVIEYFEEMGIISNKQTILIRTDKTVGNKHFTVPAKKTKFIVNFKKITKILIDKEFNEYGIDDNGNAFQKGKFKLERNGTECTL